MVSYFADEDFAHDGHDDEDFDIDMPDDDWRPGECDHCYGETVDGPLGPIYCACAIGQGASEDNCVCGPPEESSR